ncbi:TonB-dependent receptor [Psychrosphaera sp. B3R10]|uniref:TonB-dependent receptor n=1 Tax=unclassified Psychrosphaera TaxID=2641570 RepID=UPI001C088CCA|nr:MULTISPECIES: TonB-dependent receptor [unclassified Psychrosphaera]MBU2881674.1 TonB-dependent receptor [Psychrosphaera sp. I2R16]MBU2991071.1 TonB-dependent receptor [Psychrosphaera sp. B3R10]
MTSMILAGGLTTSLTAIAADESDAETNKSDVEVIEVKGFRGSLSRALFEKRETINSKETIMSEDLGKFPDLNLTESLQRVTGVAISREGGEGRAITLRGLSPSFTRTTLNGMEVPSSTDGTDSGGGVNNGRGFDFNVFASELFNRIDIQKAPTAGMEEGGIAGTVDLYSAKPFDNPGFKVMASGQAGYNDVTGEADPRLAFMISNTFADDTVGVLFSLAQSTRTVRQEGYGTVRWTTPVKDGNRSYVDPDNIVMTGATPAACADGDGNATHPVNCLWTPRLPRPDFFGNVQDRLGITGSIQWRPTDDIEITFDTLQSTLDNERTMYNFFEQFRSTFDQITPTAIKVHENGKQVVAGTYEGIHSRIESRQQLSTTEFSQYVLSGKYNISDALTLNAMVGTAKSDARSEQYRYNMTSLDSHTYSFDFSDNANAPKTSFGYDVNDDSKYNLTDGRLRAGDTLRENDTMKLDLTYEMDDFTIVSGIAMNDRVIDYYETEIKNFDDQASADGFSTPFPYSDFGKGFDGPLDAFIVADFSKIQTQLLDTMNNGAGIQWDVRIGSSWQVQEETTAAYVEANSEFEVGDMILRANVGGRFVETTTTATGYVPTAAGVDTITISESYNNFLPALNLALDATDELVVRFNLSQSMTRPSLGSLNPGNPSFDYINGTVSTGNPGLDPFTSNNMDLGFEWYFAEEALIAATYFSKELDGFIESKTEEKLVDPAYYDFINSDDQYEAGISQNPFTTPYIHSIPFNKGTNEVTGFEIAYQQPLSFLPAPFNGLGILANYTSVDAELIEGMSKNSYNFTLYYEQESYGARVSMNKRDDYITDFTGSNGNLEHGTTGPTHVDVSAFYNFNENLTFTLEVLNLTDEYERLYTTGDGTLDLMREYNHTGTTYFFGARYVM